MMISRHAALVALRRHSRLLINSPWLPAVFPTLAFAGYLAGGEVALALCALGLPMIWLLFQAFMPANPPLSGTDPVTGLSNVEQFESAVENLLHRCPETARTTACFMVEIDEGQDLGNRFGIGVCDRLVEILSQRILASTRGPDLIARLSQWQIAITLAPVKRLDLETAIQMASRLQSELEEPIKIDGFPVYVSASVGFCLLRDCPEPSADALLNSAQAALDEATMNGPSAIRAFSARLHPAKAREKIAANEVERALEAGEIVPWFQPQVATKSGVLTGVEALARWDHPTQGIIPPSRFLPALEKAGLLERLGQVILYESLAALRDFDQKSLVIPCVGVNFSEPELRNPKLAERILWELDRFGLDPKRLCVEILEHTVAESPDDMTVRNIAALSKAGCQIDLDDFGTGHASITTLRRFDIDRIKIDRSFVVQCDNDPEQRKMVSTILTMAEKLDLDTLAEGVETVGERATLAELGCRHVQGFGIARPMPTDKLGEWLVDHATLTSQPMQVTSLTEMPKRRSE